MFGGIGYSLGLWLFILGVTCFHLVYWLAGETPPPYFKWFPHTKEQWRRSAVFVAVFIVLLMAMRIFAGWR